MEAPSRSSATRTSGPLAPGPKPSLTYRAWARAEPERFALLFGLPAQGYAAPEDGPTVEAAMRAFSTLMGLVAEADAAGLLDPPRHGVSPALAAAFADKDRDVLRPDLHQGCMLAWSALHGFSCLDAYGHFDWLGAAGADALFEALLDRVGEGLGFRRPEAGGTARTGEPDPPAGG